MERLIAWLAENMPADDGRVSLVHGDYRLDNMIFAKDAPSVIAVLDWELSTLGHPFADLAYQCMQWRLPHASGFRGRAVWAASTGPRSACLRSATMSPRYCERRGIDRHRQLDLLPRLLVFPVRRDLPGRLSSGRLDGNASNPEKAQTLWRCGEAARRARRRD